MSNRLTIVFAPVGIRNGLAAAKRIGNLVAYLRKEHQVINLYRDKHTTTETSGNVTFMTAGNVFGEWKQLIAARKNFRGPHIYYHYGYPTLYNFLTLLLVKMLGFSIYFDIVEDLREIIPFKKSRLGKMNLQLSVWLLRRSGWLASGYIGISRYLCEMLRGFFSKETRILLLPISVDPKNFPARVEHERKQRINFFYGGSYAPKDDFDIMLDAFFSSSIQHNGEIGKFYLSGKCPDRKKEEILSRAKEHNINNLEFLGFLTDEEYYQYILQTDVLVMPRNNSGFANTGFPFKLGEYMATGNCVISARIGPVVDCVGEDALLYYTPENTESLSKVFNELIERPELLWKNGRYARERAFKEFNSEDHSRMLIAFITKGKYVNP
ncbi:MAG: glycosyltransferase [Chitinophagaceae bacterium]